VSVREKLKNIFSKPILSTIGLVGLIFFDVCLIAICFICHQYWWAFFWIGITALVGMFEGLSYCVTGHTISQWWWIWSESSPQMMWWSLAAAFCFYAAMTCLLLHLISPILAKLAGN